VYHPPGNNSASIEAAHEILSPGQGSSAVGACRFRALERGRFEDAEHCATKHGFERRPWRGLKLTLPQGPPLALWMGTSGQK